MLTRIGAMLDLKTRPPRSEAVLELEVRLELNELHLARKALVKDRTAEPRR